MRIAFLGAVDFSRHCLRRVLACGGRVVGVLGLPPDLAGRHSDYADLAPVAEEYRLPYYAAGDVNAAETVGVLRAWQPDMIFVFGWSRIIGPEVRAIPQSGCIGTHPALLPRNRGRHPLIWAIIEGLTETGLTFFYLDEDTDSGDILWQGRCTIAAEDDAGTLYGKMKRLADQAIAEFLPRLCAGTASRSPQDHARATYWPKRSPADGEIKWPGPTKTAHNLVRALARPYPGAHSYLAGEQIILWRGKPMDGSSVRDWARYTPGTVVAVSEAHFDVRTGDGCLRVMECDFTTAARPQVGQILGGQV